MPAFRLAPALLVILSIVAAATGQSTIRIPADQPTIQAGIRAAKNGDTVLIAPGTYFENLDFLGKAITVTSSDGAARTVVDGGGNDAVVKFVTGEPRAAIVSNLTLTNGNSHSSYYDSGGGVSIRNSQPTVLNNIITRNTCQNISSNAAGPLIQGNVVSYSLSPERCFVLQTGGIYIGGNLQPPYPGAAVAPVILGNTIENNTTGQSGDGGGDGGAGIAIWGGSPLIEGNIIRNNLTRSGSGGAINVVYGTGISIVQNLIYGNTAGCGGGAIGSEEGSLGPDTYLLIANNTIVNNTGGLGGGYSDCRKSAEVWTAFYSGGGPSIKFVNNIFQANLAPALDCGSLNSSPDEAHQSLFDHNLLFNTAGAFFASNCTDTSRLHGNVVADPQFVDVTGHDLHLRSSSPAIDAGNGSVLANLKALSGVDLTKDFDGNPREQDTTGKGQPAIDMGAYEFAGVVSTRPTRIVLSSSAFTGPAGSNFTLTATLTSDLGSPTGQATFYLDGQQIGVAPIVQGVAALSNVTVRPGVHTLYAGYDGQAAFQPAVSIYIVLSINRYATTLSLTSRPSPSISGQTVLISVHASSADTAYIPTPIQLSDYISGNVLLATLMPDSAGNASFSTSTLSLGSHYLIAEYAGDALHAPTSSFTYQQVVSGYSTTMTLSSSPNPSNVKQAVSFVAHVGSSNGVPTGAVTFSDGSSGTLGTVALDAAGNATVSTAGLTAGSHTVTAIYNPTGAYASQSASVVQVVNGLAASAVLTATPQNIRTGDVVTLSASVTAAAGASPSTPTGSVSFFNNGAALGSSQLSATGVASLATTSLKTGNNTLTCTYAGDQTYAPATCAPVGVTAQAADTALTLTASANPAPALSAVTFTATLTSGGQPSPGAVRFLLDGKLLAGGTPGAAGTTTLTLPLAAGSHMVTAEFPGSTGQNASSATVSEIAQPNPTASTLSLPPGLVYQNQQLALGAAVQPLTGTAQPYGTVTLFDRAVALATAPIAAGQSAATAQFTLASLAPGLHLLSTAYTPADANFVASTSPAVALTVLEQTFYLTAGAPEITIATEHHASMQLTLVSVGGWSGPVQLGCAPPLPPVVTCGLASGVQLASNGSLSTTLTLDTDAVLRFKSSLDDGPLGPADRPIVAFAGLLLPFAWLGLRRSRGRQWPARLLLTLIALAGSAAVSGCSGKYPDHTPPGTYVVTVTASGMATGATSPTSATVPIRLIVTP